MKKNKRVSFISIIGIGFIIGFVFNNCGKSEEEKKADELIKMMKSGAVLAVRPQDRLARIGEPAVKPLIREYRQSLRKRRTRLEDTKSNLPVSFITDPEDNFRDSIVAALGKIGTENALELLIEIANDNREYYKVRNLAIFVLGDTRTPGTEDALINLLNDEDKSIYGFALTGLKKLAARGSERALGAIIKCLNHPVLTIREKAVDELSRVNKPRATEALVKFFQDSVSDSMKLYIIPRLAKQGSGKAISVLSLALSGANRTICRTAADALGEMGSIEAVRALVRAMDSKEEFVRQCAACTLVAVRTKHVVTAVGALVFALNDESPGVRGCSIRGLGNIVSRGPQGDAGSQKAANTIIRVLNDTGKDQDLRREAVSVLGKYFGDSMFSREVIAGLFTILEDKNTSLRKAAAETLTTYKLLSSKKYMDSLIMVLKQKNNLETLIRALSDQQWDVKDKVSLLLNNLSSKDPVVAKGIVKALTDSVLKHRRKSGEYRVQVVKVLGDIGTGEAINGILWALKDRSDAVRSAGCRALYRMLFSDSRKSSPAMEKALTRVLDDPYQDVRLYACKTLGRRGSRCSALTTRALVRVLRDKDHNVRTAAAQTLEKIGSPKAAPAVPALKKALYDKQWRARQAAAFALQKIAPDKLVEGCVEVLKGNDRLLRQSAAYYLSISPLPAWEDVLIDALEDKDPEVRRFAALGLSTIKSPKALKAVKEYKSKNK